MGNVSSTIFSYVGLHHETFAIKRTADTIALGITKFVAIYIAGSLFHGPD